MGPARGHGVLAVVWRWRSMAWRAAAWGGMMLALA